MFDWLFRYANPARFMGLSGALLPWLAGAAALALAAGLYASFSAPPDYQQGRSVMILFIHVPAAIMSTVVYACIVVASLFSLVNRHVLADVAARTASDIGPQRTGIRLSPHGNLGGLSDSDTVLHFRHIIAEVSKRAPAYLHLVEPRASSAGLGDDASVDSADNLALFRALFAGPVITAGGYGTESGAEAVRAGLADAVAFGRMFLANPDMPARIRRGCALNIFDRFTSYGGGAHGYTDYPNLLAAVLA
jgi:hypothetical protein